MRTIPRNTHVAAAAASAITAFTVPAQAQISGTTNQQYFLNQSAYTHGLHLPQAPLPNGSDEIRAADGTTCKSSMASNSAYLDVGGIGSQGFDGQFDSGSVYGRIIVPLGPTPRRIDCTALYHLEIERLKSELELARMGAGSLSVTSDTPAPQATAATTSPKAPAAKTAAAKSQAGKARSWSESGWSNHGWQGAAQLGARTDTGAPLVPEPRHARPEAPQIAAEIGTWKTSVIVEIE